MGDLSNANMDQEDHSLSLNEFESEELPDLGELEDLPVRCCL